MIRNGDLGVHTENVTFSTDPYCCRCRTSLSVGKFRVAFVYCWNDILHEIVPFVNEDGDAIRAGANLGDFVAIGYKESAKVDMMCSIKRS